MKGYLSFIAGSSAIIIYIVFALISFSQFQEVISPAQNWLSDLGSTHLNPDGAIFYNIGIILTGLCLIVFFIGLRVWAIAGNKAQKIQLMLTQGFGVAGSAAMGMSSIFPITSGTTHSFWSAALYILLGTAFALSLAALRYHAQLPRWVLAAGLVVVIVNFTWCVVLNIFPLEWLTVALFLAYVGVLSVETRRTFASVG